MNRMRNRSDLVFVALVCTLAFVFEPAQAQLGKLKGLKKAVEKEAARVMPAADEEQGDVQQSGQKSGARPAARKDPNRKYPPGLSFSSVLNGVSLFPKDGRFRIDNIQGTFMPKECNEGFAVVRTADGKEIGLIDWQVQTLKTPYSLLAVHQTTDLRSGERLSSGWIPLATPGDYVLDFYTPDEHFYTIPFSVAKIGGDDAFGEGQCYVLKGAWEEWGYLYYRDAKPDMSLQWKVWLRNEGCDEKPIKVRIEVTNDTDGELVCTSREHMSHSVQPKWTRMEFDMVFPKGKDVPHGTYFKAKDLLGTDGNYTLTMKIDDTLYGTWKFAVEGGKLNYTGRTDRSNADPLTFIEGGRDAWWYAKQK